jgi:hypothetical protein
LAITQRAGSVRLALEGWRTPTRFVSPFLFENALREQIEIVFPDRKVTHAGVHLPDERHVLTFYVPAKNRFPLTPRSLSGAIYDQWQKTKYELATLSDSLNIDFNELNAKAPLANRPQP